MNFLSSLFTNRFCFLFIFFHPNLVGTISNEILAATYTFLKKKFQPNSFHFFFFLKKFQSEEAILSKKLDFNCYSALLCITFISAITRPLLTSTSKGWFYKRVMLHVIIPPGSLLPLQTAMLVPSMHFCCLLICVQSILFGERRVNVITN